jgi:hypothetical protein
VTPNSLSAVKLSAEHERGPTPQNHDDLMMALVRENFELRGQVERLRRELDAMAPKGARQVARPAARALPGADATVAEEPRVRVDVRSVRAGRDVNVRALVLTGGPIAALSFVLPIVVGCVFPSSPAFGPYVFASFLLGPLAYVAVRQRDRLTQVGALGFGVWFAERGTQISLASTAVAAALGAASGVTTMVTIRAAEEPDAYERPPVVVPSRDIPRVAGGEPRPRIAPCPAGQERGDDQLCVDACEANQERHGGVCVDRCPAGSQRIGPECVETCADGMIWRDSKCNCPPGRVRRRDKCVEPGVARSGMAAMIPEDLFRQKMKSRRHEIMLCREQNIYAHIKAPVTIKVAIDASGDSTGSILRPDDLHREIARCILGIVREVKFGGPVVPVDYMYSVEIRPDYLGEGKQDRDETVPAPAKGDPLPDIGI